MMYQHGVIHLLTLVIVTALAVGAILLSSNIPSFAQGARIAITPSPTPTEMSQAAQEAPLSAISRLFQ